MDVLNLLFYSVNDYYFNRELLIHMLEYINEKINLNIKANILPMTNTILKFEELAKDLFEKFLENLILQNKFMLEKYLSDKDIIGVLKLAEDKENPYKYEYLVILSHNIRIIINSIISNGSYYSITQKSQFINKIDRLLLDILSFMKSQLESKFIVSKDKQIISNFKGFLDSLFVLIEDNFFSLYKAFKLQKMWEKVDKEEKVIELIKLD